MQFTVIGCSEIATIFATMGAPGFRVRLQFIAADFSAIVVADLERNVPVPSAD
jgi:hypothetical protein